MDVILPARAVNLLFKEVVAMDESVPAAKTNRGDLSRHPSLRPVSRTSQ